MNYIKITAVLALISLGTIVRAQELRCKVTVNADQVQATNKRMFKTLETAATDFVNNKIWTKDNFAQDERIDCAMLITVTKFTAPDQFEASIQVNANRPVYNSGYSSPIFNFKDPDFNFSYVENSPIEFTPDQFRSNLSSVLAFYAYIVLGMDYDSFSQEGGSPYFVEAQRIVSNANNTPYTGWNGTEKNNNRFWMVDNLLQTSFLPLRTCMYNYHRNGLDVMYDNPVEARKVILSNLEEIRKVHAVKPTSFSTKLFFLAKVDEIVGIFSKGDAAEKERLLNLVRTIDPLNISRYNAIQKPN